MTAADFDGVEFYRAMDAQRKDRGLTWRQVADQIWDQSADLNARRSDHPISPSTLTGIARRADCTCQHALFILRWLARTPESFLPIPQYGAALPNAGPEARLRLESGGTVRCRRRARRERELTWVAISHEIHCSPNQLTGLRTIRFAIGMKLAMRLTQWLKRPAADFVYAATW